MAATPAVKTAQAVQRHQWSGLNRLEIGRYAEYYVKLELAMLRFDIYTPELDQRGIDFVVRTPKHVYYDIQVKSVRKGSSYVFMRESKFEIRKTSLVAVALFENGHEPDLYLIPSLSWKKPDGVVFVYRPYDKGQKSPPEYGLNASTKNLPSLAPFRFQATAAKL